MKKKERHNDEKVVRVSESGGSVMDGEFYKQYIHSLLEGLVDRYLYLCRKGCLFCQVEAEVILQSSRGCAFSMQIKIITCTYIYWFSQLNELK